jgi:hypothetical protein
MLQPASQLLENPAILEQSKQALACSWLQAAPPAHSCWPARQIDGSLHP